jgi:hypothetical protein
MGRTGGRCLPLASTGLTPWLLHVGSESQGQATGSARHRINRLHTQDNGIGNADVHALCWGMLGSVERHGRILVHETRRMGAYGRSPRLSG